MASPGAATRPGQRNVRQRGSHLEVRLPQGYCVNHIRIGRGEEPRATDTCQTIDLVFR